MSHTSTITGVAIKNRAAIEAAVAHLQSKGVKVSLKENVKPRAYFNNQAGMETPADLCLQLDKYDVGLYLQEDGTYEARFDAWANHVARHLGSEELAKNPALGKNHAHHVGKFLQEYATAVTILEAQADGRMVERIDEPDGKIKLTIMGY